MQQMMQNGTMHGPMMWGIGIGWILVLAFLVLGIAAFIKYLFFRHKLRAVAGAFRRPDELFIWFPDA